MNIYEIDAAILALVDENGEITDLAALDALQMEREQKIENAILFVKNLKAEVEAFKNEESALAARRRQDERNIERLKGYLDYALAGEKFETPRCAISWRKSVSTKITDESLLMTYAIRNHRDDLLIYAEPKISVSAVKDALKAGEDIQGAELVENLNPIIK